MQGPEKNSYKEFDSEKKFLRLENSPPPHNFSNGQSLIWPKRVCAAEQGMYFKVGVKKVPCLYRVAK